MDGKTETRVAPGVPRGEWEQVAVRLQPLVRRVVETYCRVYGLDPDDALSEANDGMVKALSSYDPGAGTTVNSYCVSHVKWKLNRLFCRVQKFRGTRLLPLQYPEMKGQTTEEIEHADPSPGPADVVSNAEWAAEVRGQLREEEYRLLYSKFVDGLTYGELSERSGVTKQAMQLRVTKLVERLRTRLEWKWRS